MRLSRLPLVILSLILTTADVMIGQPRDGGPVAYRLDAAHSSVQFSVRYLRLMEVEGRFREWDATIVNPESPERGAIAIVFRTASLDTENDTRDEHLKSPDFFDVEQYPVITFVSREVVRDGDGYVARGPLTMHGTTREIEVPFSPAYAPMTDGKGNRRAGFTGRTVIDREDFGIVGGNRFNTGFDPLVSVIDEDVEITFSIHVMIPPIQSPVVDSLIAAVDEQGLEAVVAAWHEEFPAGEGEEVETARLRMAGRYNAAGYRLMQDGRLSEAVALLELAVEGAPNSARAWSSLAEAYAKAETPQKAQEAIEQALTLDPHETRALALEISVR